jgi:hypothetical protein
MQLRPDAIRTITEGFAGAQLADPRRLARLLDVVGHLAANPSASIPTAMGSDARVQAASRLLHNPAVDTETLNACQADATRVRAEAAQDILVLHDTTDASFPHADPAEIGYDNTGKPGFRVHLSLAVDANGRRLPLGVASVETLHRATPPRKRKPGRKVANRSGSATSRDPDREFLRWQRGIDASGALLANCRSVIHVADREGDSYDLMAAMKQAGQRFVIRLRVNRRGRRAGDEPWAKVQDVAAACDAEFLREVQLSRRRNLRPGLRTAHPPRKARVATLHFGATAVELPRPRYLPKTLPETLRLGLVRVWETAPDDGNAPVEWLLYTTEPVTTPAEIARVVDIYRNRWLIEEFNAALKTGCAYEARQYESREALLTLLALSLPIATQILALRSHAHAAPTAPISDVLNDVQVEILRLRGHHKLPANPTARDGLLALASLGGHLKRNGDPGWQILMRAMVTLRGLEDGWRIHALAQRGAAHM